MALGSADEVITGALLSSFFLPPTMSTLAPHAILDEKRYSFMAPSDDEAHIDELAQLKIQLEALKSGVSLVFCCREHLVG